MTGPPNLLTFRHPCKTRRRRSNKVLMLPPPAKRPILSPGPTSPCRHRRRRGVDQQNMSAYCECAADRRVVLPKTGEAFNIGIRSISFPHYHSRRLLAHKLPSHKASLGMFIQTRSNRIGTYIPSPAPRRASAQQLVGDANAESFVFLRKTMMMIMMKPHSMLLLMPPLGAPPPPHPEAQS